MENVVIDRLSPTDVTTLAHLYNSVFRPERPPEFFTRRFLGRNNVLVLVARVDNDAIGFFVGFELKPSTFFGWLCGVKPEVRRMGVATQLFHAAIDWAKTEGYSSVRFECQNRHRAFLQFGISAEFDIVGMRWDPDRSENLVIFERVLD